MILNQYWGQTQSVLGATLLEGNPILKIKEGVQLYVDEKVGISVFIDGSTAISADYGQLYTGWRTGVAQSFSVGGTYLLHSCSFNLSRTGSALDYMEAVLYTNSGTSFGINSVPGTSIVARSALVGATNIPNYIGATFYFINFSFWGDTPIYINANEKYNIALGYSSGGVSSFIGARLDGDVNAHSGNWSVFQSSFSGWTPRYDFDLVFTINGLSIADGDSGLTYQSAEIGDFLIKDITNLGNDNQVLQLNGGNIINEGLNQFNIAATGEPLVGAVWNKTLEAQGDIYDFTTDGWGLTVGGDSWGYDARFPAKLYTTTQGTISGTPNFNALSNPRPAYTEWKNTIGEDYSLSWKIHSNVNWPVYRFGGIVRVKNITPGKETFVLGTINNIIGLSYWGGTFLGGTWTYSLQEYVDGSYRGGTIFPIDNIQGLVGCSIYSTSREFRLVCRGNKVGFYGKFSVATASGSSSPGDKIRDAWVRIASMNTTINSGSVGFIGVDPVSSTGTTIWVKNGIFTPSFRKDGGARIVDEYLNALFKKSGVHNVGTFSESPTMFDMDLGVLITKNWYYSSGIKSSTSFGTFGYSYWENSYDGQVYQLSFSGHTVPSTLDGRERWEGYLVTGCTLSDFVADFDIRSALPRVWDTISRIGIMVGNSRNYYSINIPQNIGIGSSEIFNFASTERREFDEFLGVTLDQVSVIDKFTPTIPGMIADQWYRVKVVKSGGLFSAYLNGQFFTELGMTGLYPDFNDNVSLGIGVNVENHYSLYDPTLTFEIRNLRFSRLNLKVGNMAESIGTNLSGEIDRFLPRNYIVENIGPSLYYYQEGATFNTFAFNNYNRIAETKNYGRFAKYVYAKGDEVAASNLSDQERLTKDASINEWIDYQDSNLKTETMAKELGVDKLKEKNDDSELYSMVNLPNVLLEKGDKVNVVDEGLGISRQYLVDTHLKRWTANGEFIQYTGLVRDDT